MNKYLLWANLILIISSLILRHGSIVAMAKGVPASDVEQNAEDFNLFTLKANGKYGSQEEALYRYGIYKDNKRLIELSHQTIEPQSWTMGINDMSDLTSQEFVGLYLSPPEQIDTTYDDHPFQAQQSGLPPRPVDWRATPGVASLVKNQGACGSGWAHAAVGAIEGLLATQSGQKYVNLSEQQLIDCSQENFGCNGGWAQRALAWVAKNGITTASAYPYVTNDSNYQAGKFQTCKLQVGAYKIIEPKKVQANVDSHKAAITLRPIAVNVDATNWQLYESGIFDQCTTNTNHVALAVGFGDGYWLIKNSWGTGWGVNGYIKIKDGNTCGFLTQSYMAT